MKHFFTKYFNLAIDEKPASYQIVGKQIYAAKETVNVKHFLFTKYFYLVIEQKSVFLHAWH